jgi:hypothetical protein
MNSEKSTLLEDMTKILAWLNDLQYKNDWRVANNICRNQVEIMRISASTFIEELTHIKHNTE